MKWMLPEARTVLTDRYLFMQHLEKDKLTFAINFTLKHVQLLARARKCVYLETADGVWLGSSEQFALSISNTVYTQRNFGRVMPAIHIHLLHSEARNQTERNTEDMAPINTCIPCGLPLTFE